MRDIDSLQTTLLFPTERPFSLTAFRDHTWDLTINNRVRFAGGQEVQLSFINYAARNMHQGREHVRF